MEILRKGSLLVVWGFLLSAGLRLQGQGWQPSAGHTQAAWPTAVPDAQPPAGPEMVGTERKDLVAGRPWVYVEHVSRPTMTVYGAKGRNTGAAVVVFPGGGYQILAMDLEGTEVCDWLTAEGITCVLLKYRVTDMGAYLKSGPYPESLTALEDAQRTLGSCARMPRRGASTRTRSECRVFGGGTPAAAMSVHWQRRLYPAVDAADKQSCRPDFA